MNRHFLNQRLPFKFGWPRLLPIGAALLLAALHPSANADLWAYVDDQGVTHLAADQMDDRYTLFFKGSDFGMFDLTQQAGSVGGGSSLGVKPTGRDGEPGFVLPKRFSNLDASKAYKAVQKHMQAAAKTHSVDYDLLKAVIAAESGFDPEAVSPKGAVGLMQLMPTTAAQYGVVADAQGRRDRKGQLLPIRTVEQKLTDPQINIQAGARYLAYLINLFKGELSLAVAAYNAGEGAVQRAGNRVPNYKETQGYVKTVMGLYQQFKPEPSVAPYPVANAVNRLGAQRGERVRAELGSQPSWAANPVTAVTDIP